MTGERPLRVAHLITWLPLGGVETQLLDLLSSFRQDRVSGWICCLREEGPLAAVARSRGLRVDVVPQKSRFHPRTFPKLVRYLRRQGADVVHGHMYRAATTGSVAARLAGVPATVASVHTVGGWDDRRQVWTERLLRPFKDAVVCVSEAVRRDYLARIGERPQKVHVIHNGIDVAAVAARAAVGSGRWARRIPAGRRLIGHVGRLIPDKNQAELLAAFGEARRRGLEADLVIAGEGPLRGRLEEEATHLGLADHVHFLGAIDEVPELLGRVDFLVQPSRREGFSLVLIEALAAGCPVVTTGVGGNAEAIEDGVCGVVVEPGDRDALVDSMVALARDDALRERFRRSARARADRFSIRSTAAALEQLYRRLMPPHLQEAAE